MNRTGKLHALLSTARVANIPSVVSNVWLGVAIGMISTSLDADNPAFQAVRAGEACRLALAGIFLYVSGNFFNDWMDRAWDAVNRPERALPAGIFKAPVYLVVAVLFVMLGVAVAASVNLPAAVFAVMIVACVAIYTWIHKKTVWSVIPMGLCRALLPVMGAAGMSGESGGLAVSSALVPLALCAGSALFCYIVGLSLSARSESLESPAGETRLLSRLLLVLAALLMGLPFLFEERHSWLLFIAPLAYFGWLGLCLWRFGNPVSRHVSALLAGIPLVDWIFLLPVLVAPLNWQTPPFELGFPGVASAVIPPLSFVAALLLQRLAPAT
jgi:4-hydroxybenzoate polyprenyltransferase